MTRNTTPATPTTTTVGRCFVNPTFDYLVIGGGLSLMATAAILLSPVGWVGPAGLAFLILFSNGAHFGASTVRLYTKRGTSESLPFLTMALPLVTLAALTLVVWHAESLGPHLQSLYLSWSPYHYAAQAYGIAVMYSYRSGCRLAPTDKKLLWWVAMLPFFYNFLSAKRVGLDWLAPAAFMAQPAVGEILAAIGTLLTAVAFAAPVLLYLRVWRGSAGPMPLISILALVSNGVWWFVLSSLDAFVWATVFHGLQYLALVVIFHIRERVSSPANQRGAIYHGVWFYGASLLLGYGVFQCLPLGYTFAGVGLVEGTLLVAATVNVHHFIVDAYIWRLGQDDTNRQVVEEEFGPRLEAIA
jgi:hypothetical protein